MATAFSSFPNLYNLGKEDRRRIIREVQTVKTLAMKGAGETGVKRGLKRCVNRELEAKVAHKP